MDPSPEEEEAERGSEHSRSSEFNISGEVVVPRASKVAKANKGKTKMSTTKRRPDASPINTSAPPERHPEKPSTNPATNTTTEGQHLIRQETANSGIPGAFALGNDQRAAAGESDVSTSSGDSEDISTTVPVANPVEDPDAETLPQAHPQQSSDNVPTDDSTATGKKKATAARFGCFGAIVFVVVLVLVLTLTLPRRSDDEEPTTVSPTQAPTSQESVLYSVLQLPPDAILSVDTDAALEWFREDVGQSPQLLRDPRRAQQRFALATLYYATNGQDWHQNGNWLRHDLHECDWYNRPDFALYGIFSTFIPGYLEGFFPDFNALPPPCNIDGLYQNLWLDQNNLVGTIPEELCRMLPHLKTLSLGLNALEGSISTAIGNLSQLEGLFVYGQLKGGPIPSQIGLLSHLRVLALLQNEHTGRVPSELWSLTRLDTLSLNYNPLLQGSLPASRIGKMPDLRFLLLHGVDLSGTIPTEVGLATGLEWMVMIENQLSGSLPTELGLLSNMLLADLSSTRLSGTIPSQIGRWTSLTSLVVRQNPQLTGALPSEIGLLTNLSLNLDCSGNALTSSLPTEIGCLVLLQELSFLGNDLTGTIPLQIGGLQSLELLDLANNTFSGVVPEELSSLSKSLYSVRLEGNWLLSGIIPEDLCHVEGTCSESALNPCEADRGLTFDCSTTLCGCNCTCT